MDEELSASDISDDDIRLAVDSEAPTSKDEPGQSSGKLGKHASSI